MISVILTFYLIFSAPFISGIKNPFISLSRRYSLLKSDNLDCAKSTGKFIVVLSNLQSGSNIGSICRNAMAFNAAEVILVGRKGIPQMRQADRGARRNLTFTHFPTTSDAGHYLKSQHNCTIYGIEITDRARPVTDYPFQPCSAFIFGNEGGGLSPRQRQICDEYIYIPQYAVGGMASINVACASAIIMQHFASWSKFQESTRIGEKFK